jgi:mannose-P-dolichol utilization defect protein 1
MVAESINEACLAKMSSTAILSATECYAFALSKLLGVAIIAASFALKVPQIVKILRNRSVAGLSFAMFTLELFGFVFQGSYAARHNFPLDAYLEVFVILAQNFIIIALMYHFTTGINAQAVLLLGAALALCAYELTAAPIELVVGLQTFSIAVFSVAKLPQIIKAFQDKSTGQLDLFMVTLQTLGSLTRVFTTMQSVNNPIYLFGYILGSSLNAIMTAQVLYYGSAKSNKTDAAKTKADAKSPKAKKID